MQKTKSHDTETLPNTWIYFISRCLCNKVCARSSTVFFIELFKVKTSVQISRSEIKSKNFNLELDTEFFSKCISFSAERRRIIINALSFLDFSKTVFFSRLECSLEPLTSR